MLYILLGIIAVGVLLASREGKAILSTLFAIGLVVGGLYAAFWAVILAIAFFQSQTGQGLFEVLNTLFTFFGELLLWLGMAALVVLFVYHSWKIRRQIPGKLKRLVVHDLWGKRKPWILTILALILSIFAIPLVLLATGFYG